MLHDRISDNEILYSSENTLRCIIPTVCFFVHHATNLFKAYTHTVSGKRGQGGSGDERAEDVREDSGHRRS